MPEGLDFLWQGIKDYARGFTSASRDQGVDGPEHAEVSGNSTSQHTFDRSSQASFENDHQPNETMSPRRYHDQEKGTTDVGRRQNLPLGFDHADTRSVPGGGRRGARNILPYEFRRFASVHKPVNTLDQPSSHSAMWPSHRNHMRPLPPSAPQLDVQRSTGDNVGQKGYKSLGSSHSGPPPKRQRLENPVSQSQLLGSAIDLTNDDDNVETSPHFASSHRATRPARHAGRDFAGFELEECDKRLETDRKPKAKGSPKSTGRNSMARSSQESYHASNNHTAPLRRESLSSDWSVENPRKLQITSVQNKSSLLNDVVEQSSNMRNQFIRSDTDTVKMSHLRNRVRAKERMQSRSTLANADGNETDESHDELNSQPTIHSKQKVEKPSPSIRRNARDSPQTTALASVNDSAGTARKSPSIDSAHLPLSEREEKHSFRRRSLAIRVTMMILEKEPFIVKGPSILWDSEERQFHVYDKTTLEKLGTFGKKEVMKKVAHAEDGILVQLCGSVGDLSNGKILIEFNDLQGKREFIHLMEEAEYHLKLMPFSGEHLESIRQQLLKNHMDREAMMLEFKQHQSKEPRRPRNLHQDLRVKGGATEDRISYEWPPDSETTPRRPLGTVDGITKHPDIPCFPTDQILAKRNAASDDVRRSLRNTKPKEQPFHPVQQEQKWTVLNSPTKWSNSVVFPNEGPRRVTVDFNDLERLDEGEFLNDNVINFALRRIEEKMSPEVRKQVHFFNTFFYDTLSNKNGKRQLNYDAVKRWTKHQDLLSTPYVVVPINMNLHWLVAIIFNLPALTKAPPEQDREGVEVDADDKSNSLAKKVIEVVHDMTSKSRELFTPSEASPTVDTVAASEPQSDSQQEQSVDRVVGVVSPGSTILSDPDKHVLPNQTKSQKRKSGPQLRKPNADSPVIMTLDSMRLSRPTEIRYLKHYICEEARDKRNLNLDAKTLQGMSVTGIPEQQNFVDCGVYLVGYIEEFAKDPKAFVDKVLNRQMGQDKEFADFDPSEKRAEIRQLLLSLSKEQEAERKAKKQAKNAAKVATAVTSRASPSKPSESMASIGPTSLQAAPELSTVASRTQDNTPSRHSTSKSAVPSPSPSRTPLPVKNNGKTTHSDDEDEMLDSAEDSPFPNPLVHSPHTFYPSSHNALLSLGPESILPSVPFGDRRSREGEDGSNLKF